NDTADSPPAGVIPIPFSGQALAAGYRVAVFDEGPVPPATGLPQTPLGFATQIAPGVYEFTTPTLTDGSHFLTARVQMIDPANPTRTGFGGRSVSLEVVIDTAAPPAYFGTANNGFDGLDAGSDSGVNVDPPTLVDRVTNVTDPTFYGTAEANSVIRVYVDVDGNPATTTDRILIGQTVATPIDGTHQFP